MTLDVMYRRLLLYKSVLCTLNYELDESFEPQDSEGHKVQTRERLGQPFIIAHQAAKACCPRMTPLHHPPPWQQHTPLFSPRAA